MTTYYKKFKKAARYFYIVLLVLILIPVTLGENTTNKSSQNYVMIENQETGINDMYAVLSEGYEQLPNQETPIKNNSQPRGDVIIREGQDGTSGVYISLDNVSSRAPEGTVFSKPIQGKAVLNMPVKWYQNITLTNSNSISKNLQINLMNYQEEIGDLLEDATKLEIYQDNEIISETPVIILDIPPKSTETIEVVYETPAVNMEQECREETLLDLLPADAQIIDSDLNQNTIIRKTCNIKVYHDTLVHYQDVEIIITDLDITKATSVYYVEGGEYLPVVDSAIQVPEI